MKNIVFTHSYFLYLDPKQQRAGNAYPPLGTIYAAALLRENNYKVSLFDAMLAQSPEELEPVLQKEMPAILIIYDDGFNYLTKMCLTNMREAAFRMIGLGKKYNCQIIISSSDSTDHFEKYLDAGADFVIPGEGEMTLLDLVNCLNNGANYSDLQGIIFRENVKTVNKGKRPVMRDLDLLPFPAWDLIDIPQYKSLWKKKHGYFSLNIATTRGCTYKCNWCAKPIFGNRYNVRSPKNVIEEIKYLMENFGMEHIWFCDDIFGLKPGWISEFANLVVQEKLRFRFKIQSRADLLTNENAVKNLAKAGCEMVWLGAESGSQKILDAMDKGITLEQIYESRKLLQQYKIQVAFFLQFGYPGELEEDIKDTIKMVLELLPEEIGISVTYPLPGTQLYEKVKAELTEKANWKDSDELAMMFANTYPKAFYKDLQRHVHQIYRKAKSLAHLNKVLKEPFNSNFSEIKSAAKTLYRLPLHIVRQNTLDNLIVRYGNSRF
jgi:radical SAM superfamily enzyme YgiQ (UPF0313 family)